MYERTMKLRFFRVIELHDDLLALAFVEDQWLAFVHIAIVIPCRRGEHWPSQGCGPVYGSITIACALSASNRTMDSCGSASTFSWMKRSMVKHDRGAVFRVDDPLVCGEDLAPEGR